MKTFPLIITRQIDLVFSSIKALYDRDQVKIAEACERASACMSAGTPFVYTPDISLERQLDQIGFKIKVTAERSGQNLLVRLIEELFLDLIDNGARGVTPKDFLSQITFRLDDGSIIHYSPEYRWYRLWTLTVDENERDVRFCIRDGRNLSGEVVPRHILQFVGQGMYGFKCAEYAVAMALMSIVLEGTLRDVIFHKSNGREKIKGLGHALFIARNKMEFLSPTDLPSDLDEPIQLVRNNLIHLSGKALDEKVKTYGTDTQISLRDFLEDRNRIFDAVCTIGDAVSLLYCKIFDNTI